LLSPTNFAIKIVGSSKLETRFKKFIKRKSSLLNFVNFEVKRIILEIKSISFHHNGNILKVLPPDGDAGGG
jgi:hypothetical protein